MLFSYGSWFSSEPLHDGAAKAAHAVVVDHADRLHISVADRAAHEIEAALPEVLAERIGERGPRRHLGRRAPGILQRPAVDEAPQIGIEAAERFLDVKKRARVTHSRFDFEAIANDALVVHQRV